MKRILILMAMLVGCLFTTAQNGKKVIATELKLGTRSAKQISNDATGAFRSSAALITEQAAKAYADLIGNNDWANIKQLGADATGVTDASVVIQAAINSGKSVVYAPLGVYQFTNVQLKDSITIISDGAVFVNNSNKPLFKASKTFGGKGATLSGFIVRGTKSSGATDAQEGINIDSTQGLVISNVRFDNIGGYAVHFDKTSIGGTYIPTATRGNRMINCEITNSKGGISFDTTAEYNDAIGCSIWGNDIGVFMAGGNNTVVGGKVVNNTYGFYFTGGTNHGHGDISGVTVNHNRKFYSDGCTLGMSITGTNIYCDDSIIVKNSANFIITGGWFYAPKIYFDNNTNCSFNGTGRLSAAEPVITVGSGESPTYIRSGKVNNTLSWIDPKYSREFGLGHTNGIVTFSGMDSIVVGYLPRSSSSTDSVLVKSSGGSIKSIAQSALSGGGSDASVVAYNTITGNYTTVSGDHYIYINAGSTNITLTIPLASTVPGKKYVIQRKGSGSTGDVQIIPSSGTIIGLDGTSFSYAYVPKYWDGKSGLTVVSIGGEWVCSN